MTSGIHEGAAPTPASHNPQKLLTDHLDLWTTAVRHKSTAGRGSGHGKNRKIELAGIHKLRELILELAVRGKLVPQNPDDEPASELLKRIEAEKAQLIKDGKLKKQKPLLAVSDDEKPFELPQGWEWVRLGAISEAYTGYAFKSSEYIESGMLVLRVTNINQDGTIDTSDAKFISPAAAENDYKKFELKAGDVLLVMVGGSLGKIGVVPHNILPAVLNQNMWKLQRFGSVVRDFFIYGLKHINKSQITITNSTHGHLSQGEYFSKVFPLPPLAEQQRIVAKVDELMALCDQLEQQSEHQLDAHQQLTETLLSALLTPAAGALTDATDVQELSDNWQRLAQHFDLLFSGPMGAWAIDRLKDTILQLAVMGKLVPQNPDDEPAAELLKRIDAEKTRLVKEGKIKKQKPLPPVSDDEKLFELPQGWAWVRLTQIGVFSGGKTPSKARSDYWNGNIPWVSPKDMKTAQIEQSEDSVTQKAIDDGLELFPPETILTVVRSGILRHTLPVAITKVHCSINQDIKALKLHIPELSTYMHLLLKGFEPFILKNLTKTGTTVESVKVEEFMNQAFIFPPLAEQQRIVAKVDELFALCDQLKERLQQASDTQLNLTDAIVEQALN